jgi:uncharacterized protein (TIGR02217 family)
MTTPAFHEVRFPVGISLGATGGPERRTQVVTLGSGFEERNQQWANSRRSYQAGYGVKTVDDLYAVLAFFEERRAKLTAFRWKDWSDFKSCSPLAVPEATDQGLGTGDGATHTFQLIKTYGGSFSPWVRTIKKPVAGTVRVAVAGTELLTGWTVDTTTGVITITAAPSAGQAVSAGFEFDTPARFDTDSLLVNLEQFNLGAIQHIPIIEVLL